MGQKTRYNQSDWFYMTVERSNVGLPLSFVTLVLDPQLLQQHTKRC